MAAHWRARVLYDFEGEDANAELSIYEEEYISVVNQDAGEGWVEAVKDDGKQGLVPAAYIEYVAEDQQYETVENVSPPLHVQQPNETHHQEPAGVQFNQPQDHGEWSDEDSDDGQSHAQSTRYSVDYDEESRSTHTSRSNTIKKSMNRFTPYVKSGAEDFIMGKDKDMHVQDMITIISPNNIDLVWQPSSEMTCEITEPIKKQKFKGIKSFMSYHITPHTTNLTVERRYKQFDWFHDRLGEKFPCLIIPPLPEKVIAGKFQEEFIEQRRDKLQQWLNRIGRHPIIAHCSVTNHFLTCQDEKQWKTGKRDAEADRSARSGFFLTVKCEAPLPELLNSESYVGSFSTFSKKMEGNCDRLVRHNDDYTNKMMGGIKNMYTKYGQVFKEMGEVFDTGPLSNSKPVNVALMGTGRCFQEISDVYENQPRVDAHVLSEAIREYQGILSSVPDMLHVHKGAAQKVKDFTKNEGEKDADEEAQLLQRYSTISAAVMAEINHFHKERNKDFNIMIRNFLSSQIEFHENIAGKLKHALSQYPEANMY